MRHPLRNATAYDTCIEHAGLSLVIIDHESAEYPREAAKRAWAAQTRRARLALGLLVRSSAGGIHHPRSYDDPDDAEQHVVLRLDVDAGASEEAIGKGQISCIALPETHAGPSSLPAGNPKHRLREVDTDHLAGLFRKCVSLGTRARCNMEDARVAVDPGQRSDPFSNVANGSRNKVVEGRKHCVDALVESIVGALLVRSRSVRVLRHARILRRHTRGHACTRRTRDRRAALGERRFLRAPEGQQGSATGTFSGSGFAATPAAGSGTDGYTGQGGGAGGASDGVGISTGASGGAGGMGGCGGKAGTGGGGGGASVALLSWINTGLVLDGCVLVANAGGAGGKGGNGGPGGLGQNGANGGAGYVIPT